MAGEVRPGMWQKTFILFDLDGTLTDPAEGITRSIQYACERLAIPIPAREELLFAIGPPIQSTFARLLATEDECAIRTAVGFYRDRYASHGMLRENAVYPGVESMLAGLKDARFRLYVATSKPIFYAAQILDHFGLHRHFAAAYGSELDGTRANKADLIGWLLECEGIAREQAVMVGDRKHDILGAKEHGVYSIGVAYGYGSREELTVAGADALCDSPADVLALLRACN